MPGRYSHSVVLADYTTRGVISLPQDQYERYKEYVPIELSKATPTGRLGRSRSAQPIYQPPTTSQEEWETVDLRKAKPSLSANTTPVRTRVGDSDVRHYHPPDGLQILNNYRERSTRSTPTVNNVNLTAYSRQQQRSGASNAINTHGKRISVLLESEEYSASPVSQNPKGSRSPKIETCVPQAIQHPRTSTKQGVDHVSSSGPLTSSSVKAVSTKSGIRNSVVGNSTQALTYSSKAGSAERSGPKNALTSPTHQTEPHSPLKANPTSGVQNQAQKWLGDSERINRDSDQKERSLSRASRNTQIWDPKPKAEKEPDFDGFSDKADGPDIFHDVPKQFLFHSRDSSEHSVLPIQRPDSNEGRPLVSPPVSSLRSDRDRNNPSRATGDSSYGHRSESSKSSMSASNAVPNTTTNRNLESTRGPKQQSVHEKSWTLPEIQEDLGFSPSIFEDHEGGSDKLKLDFSDLGLSIGQISSGKDVSFDNDAASELSAALPPPISRFKDEEDEFTANMAKLFGSEAIKKGSSTVSGRSSSKKGFFSKFRSKG